MNRCIIDFLTFSIRVDNKSPVHFSERLSFDYICNFLRIPVEEFTSMGRVKYYRERYECNNISIAVPYEASESTQGYNVSMSGNGCRFYEAYIKQGEMIDAADIWRHFFSRLRSLTDLGLAVNVSRIDVAIDDFSGSLNIERIVKAIEDDCVATRFQKKAVFNGNCDMYLAQSAVKTSYFKRIRSSTVEFGSRQSRSFCRIYDKRAEQMQKHYNDKEEMKRLQDMPHWVRLEVEFKDENAIKIVNAYIEQKHFPHFFAGYLNNMLRFVTRDDSNISRCSVARWWRDFIGTTFKTSMACGDYKPVTAKRHLEYVHKMLSGSIYTAINLEGIDLFLNRVINRSMSKLSAKHKRLCGYMESELKNLCSADLWGILKPSTVTAGAGDSEYYYTDGAFASC